MRKYILSLCVILFLISCNSSQLRQTQDNFEVQEEINLIESGYPELIGIGLQLIKNDSLLFISDFHGPLLINAFNLTNKTIYKSFASKGNGPEEFLSPIDIQLLDQKLYILNRPAFSLNHIVLDSLDNISIINDFQLPSKSDRFIPLTENLFVFSGMWEDYRYSLLNLNDQSLKEFGAYPDFNEKEKDIPNEVKAVFHHSKFLRHPEENYFLSISPYTIEKFSFDRKGQTTPRLEKRKQLGKYDYNFTDGEVITAQATSESEPRVKEVGCSKNYIFLVVENHQTKGSNIKVYDWDFKPVKLLKCDKRITCLVIDEQTNKAYCIAENPEDTLYEFNIQSL